MVSIHEAFRSIEAANLFIKRTLRQYAPAEYGTNLHLRRDRSGDFEVTGYRFA